MVLSLVRRWPSEKLEKRCFVDRKEELAICIVGMRIQVLHTVFSYFGERHAGPAYLIMINFDHLMYIIYTAV